MDGCKQWYNCLSCPFPKCYANTPASAKRFFASQWVKASINQGYSIRWCAKMLNLSIRTIYRYAKIDLPIKYDKV